MDRPRLSVRPIEHAEQLQDAWHAATRDGRIDAAESAHITYLVASLVTATADVDEQIAYVVSALCCGVDAPRPTRLLRERRSRLGWSVIDGGGEGGEDEPEAA